MPSELPRFSSLEQITPGPVVSSGQQYSALLNLFSQIGDVVHTDLTRRLHDDALEKGQEAGLNEDFKPIPNINQNARIFNKVGLETHKQLVSSQIDDHYKELGLKVGSIKNAKERLLEFDKLSKAYNESILNQSHPSNSFDIGRRLEANKSRVLASINKDIATQARRGASVALSDSLNTSKEQISNYIQDGNIDAAKSELLNMANQSQLGVISGNITIKQREAIMSRAHKDFVKNTVEHEYLNMPVDEKQKFVKDFIKQKTPGISTDDKVSIVHRLKSIDNILDQKVKINSSIARQRFKQHVENIEQSGVTPDENIIHQVKLTANDQQIEEIDRKIRDAQQVHELRQVIISSPVSEYENLLNGIKPKKDDPNFSEKNEIFTRVSNQVQQARRQILNDPYAFFEQHPAVRDLSSQVNQVAGIGLSNIPATNSGYSADDLHTIDLEANIQAQRNSGIPDNRTKVATNAQIQGDLSALQSTDFSGRMAFFENARGEYGKFYPQYIRQMVQSKFNHGTIDSSIMFLGGLSPSTPNIKAIEVGLTTPVKELREANTDKNLKDLNGSLQSDSVTSFGQFFRTTNADYVNYIDSIKGFEATNRVEHINSFKNYVSRVSMSMMAAGQSSDDAFDSAVKSITSEFGFVDFGGQMLRIPSKVDPSIVTSYANKLRRENLKDFDFVIGNAQSLSEFSKKDRRKLVFDTLISPGKWVNNSTNDGLVYVDAKGIPVTNKKGKRFEFKYLDAINNSAVEPDFRDEGGLLSLPIFSEADTSIRKTKNFFGIRDALKESDKEKIID